VRSAFVYTREAHPGEIYPHHDSMERKLAHARVFQRLFGVRRTILVDDLAGTGHRGFGMLPNMTYILDRRHVVVFRSNWTEPRSIRAALRYLLDMQEHRADGARLAPFYAELHGFRRVDDPAFEEGLRRNGPKASREFHEVMARRKTRESPGLG